MTPTYHFQSTASGILYVISLADGRVIKGHARTLSQALHAVSVELAAL